LIPRLGPAVIPYLEADDPFPPVDLALRDPNGLLAAGGDLSPSRLLDAYGKGIFPWFNEDDPVLWWSPDPRMVLPLDEVRVARSLRRTIKSRRFRVTADTAFTRVMAGCAEPRRDQQGTWITDDMTRAYERLVRPGVRAFGRGVDRRRADGRTLRRRARADVLRRVDVSAGAATRQRSRSCCWRASSRDGAFS
jgi:leucyl/phenylalanyl-tRNA--protein transferase